MQIFNTKSPLIPLYKGGNLDGSEIASSLTLLAKTKNFQQLHGEVKESPLLYFIFVQEVSDYLRHLDAGYAEFLR